MAGNRTGQGRALIAFSARCDSVAVVMSGSDRDDALPLEPSLHDIMAEAARWFVSQLNGLSGANARRYVGERGLTPETVERFGLGFAPDGNKLKAALKGHGEDKLLECGLIGRAEDRDETYDRFRGRLMFPIRDPRGRVVGFGGRTLGDGQPKYLNSPDTALFDKGRLLYNLDQAGPVARKSARLFVVEGYLDVIALSQAGIAEAVAPLGTALTEPQLQLLWRIVPEPILCFDGDKAGLAAAGRAARRALPLLRPGCSLRILTLPQGQDPDDIIKQQGPEHFLKLAQGAEALHAFLWRSVLESGDASTPERRAGVKQQLRELSALIVDEDMRRLYSATFMAAFGARFGYKPAAPAAPPASARALPPVSPDAGVRLILSIMIRFPDLARKHARGLAKIRIRDSDLGRLRDAIVESTSQAYPEAALAEAIADLGLEPLATSLPRLRLPPDRDHLDKVIASMT